MPNFTGKVPTIIVANNNLFRDALSQSMSSDKYAVVASTSSLDVGLLSALKLDDSNLLVLVASQDTEDTLSQLRMYRELNLSGHIVVVAQDEKSLNILPILRAGAHACLSKDTTSDALLKTIELVMLGVTVVSGSLFPALLNSEDSSRHEAVAETITFKPSGEVASRPSGPLQKTRRNLPTLSDNEKLVLACLIVGDCNKSIAQKVGISDATVKVHIKAIFRKFGLKNRTHAAVWAINEGYHILNSMGANPLVTSPIVTVAQQTTAEVESAV